MSDPRSDTDGVAEQGSATSLKFYPRNLKIAATPALLRFMMRVVGPSKKTLTEPNPTWAHFIFRNNILLYQRAEEKV